MANTICPLCSEAVEDESLILHMEIDEWLLQLVLQDHPDWKQSDGACGKCWEKIRELNEQAERIQYVIPEASGARTAPVDRRVSR